MTVCAHGQHTLDCTACRDLAAATAATAATATAATVPKNLVTVLRGAPGIGKSAWALRRATERARAVTIVSADDYFTTSTGYAFNASKLTEAHNECLRGFLVALQLRVPHVIVDNTNTSDWEISPYIALARVHGYATEILHFDYDHTVYPVRLAASRLALRTSHGVPSTTIEQALLRLEKSLPPPFPSQRVLRVAL